jgi:ankyrin repeat protein
MTLHVPNSIGIEKISRVFQSLLDIVENSNNSNDECPVPVEIESLVLNLQIAHHKFEKGIEEYMHKKERGISEVKTLETIVENNPHYLTVPDKQGNLPIHTAARDSSSSSTYIPLLAKAGIKHVADGESGRGGLLVEDTNGFCTLRTIVQSGSVDTIEALRRIEPPLVVETDVKELILLHDAIFSRNLDMVELLIDMDPSGLFKKSIPGNLPIHLALSLDAARLLMQKSIEYDPDHESIGGLFEKNNEGQMPIDKIVHRFGSDRAWECIGEVFSANKKIPILHKTILHAPKYLDNLITNLPYACFLRDEDGRLPIHVALEAGIINDSHYKFFESPKVKANV